MTGGWKGGAGPASAWHALPREFLLFLVDAPPELEKLRRALERGDAPRAERIAHYLKAAANRAGAERFRRRARQVEEAAQAGTLADHGRLWERLHGAYEEVSRGLVEGRR